MKFNQFVFSIWVLVGIATNAVADQDSFLVVVHSSNPITGVSRKFLSNVFLKKITFWEDGTAISPVDLKPDSRPRKEFSEQVLRKPVAAIKSYWQQMIFSGQAVHPVELNSDEAVIRYVATHPNAVAYVSGSTPLNSKVKAITWSGE